MSKKFKRVTAYYPVEDIVQVELLLQVDDTITDEELKERIENSDLEDFGEDSGIELQSNEIVDRDYSTDPTDDWQERIAVYLNEDISKEEWEENYEGDDND